MGVLKDMRCDWQIKCEFGSRFFRQEQNNRNTGSIQATIQQPEMAVFVLSGKV